MLLLLGLTLGAGGTAAAAGRPGGAVVRPAPSRSDADGPPRPEETAAERRAVRGVAVDAVQESPELRDLRAFEEETFPRGGIPVPESQRAATTEAGLPGRWAGSGDLPPELRSPETAHGASGSAPATPDSQWLRSLKLPNLPIRWDAQVLRYLEYFKSDPRGHAIMGAWLRRSGRFRALFESVMEKNGLPRDLFYVAMVESGFEPGAVSRVGAGGIWQFMRSSAHAYGLEVSYWIDERRDPERAADAAARFLKDLYVRFGSWPLVFAAYNAGYGAVLSAIARYNTNDFWELVRHEAGLPWESSLYVPKILAAAIVGHNREAFGFGDLSGDAAFAYDRVEVPAGTSLAVVARAAGARSEVLAALNPHLIRDRVPPDRGAMAVRIPAGTRPQFVEAFERTRGSDKLETVVVRFGETLDDVAKARGITTRELRRLNGVKDSAEVRAGTALLAPKAKPAVAAAKEAEKSDDADEDDTDDQILVAVPDRVFSYEGRERVFYRTRDGDTLDEIASVFGVRIEELVDWNNVDPAAKIHPRMVLQLFVGKDFDPRGVLLVDAANVRVVTLGSEEFHDLEVARRGKKRLMYTARPGDTVIKVARRYGITPGDLARINKFSYSSELTEGQKVIVYAPNGEPPREVAMGRTPEPKRTGAASSSDRRPTASAGKGPAKVASAARGNGKSAPVAKSAPPKPGKKK